jgi:long-chain acyl-CoA synthetase
MATVDDISSGVFTSIPASFHTWGDLNPGGTAYASRDKDGWRTATWETYVAETRSAGRALIGLGLDRGDRVAILSRNRPKWTIIDFACMSAGGATVGIYPTSSSDQIAFILEHSGAVILFVDDAGLLESLQSTLSALPDLETIVAMEGTYASEGLHVLDWEGFLNKGLATGYEELDARLTGISPDDVAMLVYTSGTTGAPKAVALSHGNIEAAGQLGLQLLGGGRPTDKVLSYLPLAHSAGRGEAVLAPALAGYAVYFTTSVERLADDLREVRPDIFIGVPRIWEKMRAAMETGVRDASPVKRALFRAAFRMGEQAAEMRRRGRSLSGFRKRLYAIADRAVLARIRERTGLGGAHALLCGSAPVSAEVLAYLSAIGLDVREVYGLTECGGPATFNRHGEIRLGTVGRAFDGAELRLADDGELLIGGTHVFKGYYRDAEASEAALDGRWLRSGDLATVDDDGFVRIVGRKKDLIITAGGRNVSPQPIETMLLEHPLVSGAIVVGDGRKYLSALIALHAGMANTASSDAWGGPAQIPADIRAQLERHVDRVNSRLARSDTIKRFEVISEPFSITRGELTPTLKQKRDAIEEHYRHLVDRLYD